MLELLAQHQYLMAENRIMKAQQSNPCDRRKLSDAKVKIPSAQTLAPLRREFSIPAPLPPPISTANPFSVRSAVRKMRRFPAVFRANLLTARGATKAKIGSLTAGCLRTCGLA